MEAIATTYACGSNLNELGLNKRESRKPVDSYFEELIDARLAAGEQIKLSWLLLSGNFDLPG